MDDSALHCLNCGYNLTGLAGDVCPECGIAIDWDLLRNDPELRRRGSPCYLARGWAVVPRTLATLLLLLFRPRSFALRFRADEAISPAVLVLLLAMVPNGWVALGCPPFGPSWSYAIACTWEGVLIFLCGVGLLLILFAAVIAGLSGRGSSQHWRFRHRFRFWCIIGMYSMAFAPAYAWMGSRTRGLADLYYWHGWPAFIIGVYPLSKYGSALSLWWTTILCVVLWYRARPRWLAIILMLAAMLFVCALVHWLDAAIPRLARS